MHSTLEYYTRYSRWRYSFEKKAACQCVCRLDPHSFLSFPYVCPEPVLAKSSFLYQNGAKMAFLSYLHQAGQKHQDRSLWKLVGVLLSIRNSQSKIASRWDFPLPSRHSRKVGLFAHTADCIIIAPKRLKLRLSGSARKSQNGFETRRCSNFMPFWLEPSRFYPAT